MSGYFARLMTQTGVGESRSAPVPATVARPSLTEEFSTVNAPLPQPNMTVDTAPRLAPLPQDVPVDRPSGLSPSDTLPQFTLPAPSPAHLPERPAPIETAPPQETAENTRDTGFESANEALDWLSARSLPSNRTPVMEPGPDATSFHLAEEAPSETRTPSQAETAQAATAPVFRLAPSPNVGVTAPASSQETTAEFPTVHDAPAHHTDASENPPLREEAPRFSVPREIPPVLSERLSASPRATTPTPSVRIGSIQIGVHSAPPPESAASPAQSVPEAPPPACMPSMRRFYLRSW